MTCGGRIRWWLGVGLGLVLAGGSSPALPAAETEIVPSIRILEPHVGAQVSVHPVLVRGTVEPSDPGMRITLNGRPVFVIQRGEWATLIDLPAGPHGLVAEVRRRGRLLSRAERRVTVVGPVPDRWPLQLMRGLWWPLGSGRAVPIATPPYEQLFLLTPGSEAEGELDPDGTGRLSVSLGRGREYVHTYGAPGFYAPRLWYRDQDGRVLVQQALVVMLDRAWLEPILQDLWARFHAAMERDDQEEALVLIDSSRRRLFRLLFEEFGPAEIRRWIAGFSRRITLVGAGGFGAECREDSPRGMHVHFALDPAVGQWRVVL